MNEFTHRLQFGMPRDPLLQEILDCLDIVIGGPLDGLDPLGIRYAEAVHDTYEHGQRGGAQGGTSTISGSPASASSQRTSTRTR